MKHDITKKLSQIQKKELISILQTRFDNNLNRHKGIDRELVFSKLKAREDKIISLYEMEKTGGEPDVVDQDKKSGEFLFFDCSAESPALRRSLCYDLEALESRKEFKPENNAIDMAHAMGVQILTEEQYRYLQQFGKFDTKTSSWIKTPEDVRKLGGALFADFRYGRVFIYHNGASSYYAARGFRASLSV